MSRKRRNMTFSERIILEIYNELKKIRDLYKRNENRIVDVYSITIPEDGDTRTFSSGTTEIDLKLGVITNPDETIEDLKRSLDAYQPKDLLHAVSISPNKDIKFKLDNGTYYSIKSNKLLQLPNVTYRNITIVCTESTEIKLFCSTNPGAVLSEFAEGTIKDNLAQYKINDIDDASIPSYYGFTDKDGNWYILEENATNKTYRYYKGSSAYTTNWTGRASLTYDYFYNIF